MTGDPEINRLIAANKKMKESGEYDRLDAELAEDLRKRNDCLLYTSDAADE